MNYIELIPPRKGQAPLIRLTVSNHQDWTTAERLAGSMSNEGPGVYTYTLSALNLQRIFAAFTGDRKPVIRGGEWLLNKEREKFRAYQKSIAKCGEILQKERVAIEPNGKFVPYAHQTKIIGVLQNNPFSMVAADCGLGKTGSVGRAVELAIEAGEVMRGKILVSAPLSILETSWLDDIRKFTNLKAGLLWFNMSNKDLLGEKTVIYDYGPLPTEVSTVTTKTKSVVMYKDHVSGKVKDELNTFDKAGGAQWKRYKAKVKVGIGLDGIEHRFGEVVAQEATKEKTKDLKVREVLKDPQYDIFLINHDGVKNYEDALKEHEFAWVIVDESTKIKSPKSKVFKSHVSISWNSKRRTTMSGTPNPNGFIDLWAQYYFLDRGLTLEASMKDFLAEYFSALKIGHFGGKDAVKYVMQSKEAQESLITRAKQAGIFLKQRDCIDLPPRTDMLRVVRMTPEQERAYLEMEEELITEFQDHVTSQTVRAEAQNILTKMMKLRQITSGFMAGEEGIKGKFASNPKLEDLDSFVEELGDLKLVIACQFKQEILTLLEHFKDVGVAAIYGDVSVNQRNESIRDFQTTDKIKIMVLQPQAAAHGITLTRASHLLFYSLDYNFEYYYQTAKRIERIGQQSNIFVTHSLAALSDGSPTIDHDLMDVLQMKSRDREELFKASDSVEMATQLVDRMIKRSKNL